MWNHTFLNYHEYVTKLDIFRSVCYTWKWACAGASRVCRKEEGMNSVILQEAALDPDLSTLAYRVLIYIGGAQKSNQYYCMHGTAALAEVFGVSLRDIKAVRHQLHRRGYLIRTIGVVRTRTGRLIRHYYYRSNLTIVPLSSVARSA